MTKPKRQQPMGPKAVRGSEAARRHAALLLEVWCGVRTTQAASDAMGVAVTRFYQLEARALQMVVAAMEPRPRGRQNPDGSTGRLPCKCDAQGGQGTPSPLVSWPCEALDVEAEAMFGSHGLRVAHENFPNRFREANGHRLAIT